MTDEKIIYNGNVFHLIPNDEEETETEEELFTEEDPADITELQ